MDYDDKELSDAAEKILRLDDSTKHRMSLPEIKGDTGFDEEKIKSAFEELKSNSIDIEPPESLEINELGTESSEKSDNTDQGGKEETARSEKSQKEEEDQEKDIKDSKHEENSEKEGGSRHEEKTGKSSSETSETNVKSGNNQEMEEELKEINERVQKLENKVEGVIDRLDTLLDVKGSGSSLSPEAKEVLDTLKSLDGEVSVEHLKNNSNLSESEIKDGYRELKSKGKI
ncbi:MAG: hypothetical protein ABEJ03_02860 [Candidatus Nanohaloarchaea archaeon]